MAKSFIFLEIQDPEINALISGIRLLASKKPPKATPHITIRGPYTKPISPAQLRRYERLLSEHPVVLDGIDSFEVSDKVAVYIKVQHPALRRVWWKPDFP